MSYQRRGEIPAFAFKAMAGESGIPYQTLINLYLDECVREKKKLQFV
ncbi:MAG: hypothetical protein Q4B73_10035 [Lachnospiraceae bacterium]|nr:hypothetical protein [Lachnospiraceae bacterium]